MTKLVKLNKQWQSVTCKVWPNTWEEVFRHKSTIDNQYWVSEAEPNGDCGVINIFTLKKDSDYFWRALFSATQNRGRHTVFLILAKNVFRPRIYQ